LQDDYAWDITEGLTTEVGPRLAGTEAEARARDWAVAKLKSLGFSNVRVETFEMPVWVRGEEKAWITAPFPQPLVVTALGNSGATPPQGIEAELVGFDTIEELEAAPEETVRGKIVFVSHAMTKTQDGSSYGAFGGRPLAGADHRQPKGRGGNRNPLDRDRPSQAPHRRTELRRRGGSDPCRGAVDPRCRAGAADSQARPAGADAPADDARGNIGTGKSGNVIAEVPGRDPEAPPILVACHLDSWDLGTGAVDDAAGCGIVAAAAKRIMDAGTPLRPIRIVWFGAEEVGLVGGYDYASETRQDKPHHAIAESDFGAGRVWKVDSRLGEARKERSTGAAGGVESRSGSSRFSDTGKRIGHHAADSRPVTRESRSTRTAPTISTSTTRRGHARQGRSRRRCGRTSPHGRRCWHGRGDRIRTCDPLLPKQMRYQAAPLPDPRSPRRTSG
jgi:carboxypeptidase Q